MSRTWKVLFGAFVIAVIVGSAILISRTSNSQVSEVAATPSVEQPAFKTYSDKSFSVRYPSNYDVNQDKTGIVTISGPNGKIMIGGFDFTSSSTSTVVGGVSQIQNDELPKDIRHHGDDGVVVSALFYQAGDDATMKELKAIQDTIITTLAVVQKYTNDKYGFSLELPAAWSGYTVIEESNAGDASSTVYKFNLNNEEIFYIIVFSKDEFAKITPEENPIIYNSKIAENADFVFTASGSQDVSENLAPRRQEVEGILKTFKMY